MEDRYRSPLQRTPGLNLTRSPIGNGSSGQKSSLNVTLTPARSIGSADRPPLLVDRRASGGLNLHYARLGANNSTSAPDVSCNDRRRASEQSDTSIARRLNLSSALNVRRSGEAGYSPRSLNSSDSPHVPYRTPRRREVAQSGTSPSSAASNASSTLHEEPSQQLEDKPVRSDTAKKQESAPSDSTQQVSRNLDSLDGQQPEHSQGITTANSGMNASPRRDQTSDSQYMRPPRSRSRPGYTSPRTAEVSADVSDASRASDFSPSRSQLHSYKTQELTPSKPPASSYSTYQTPQRTPIRSQVPESSGTPEVTPSHSQVGSPRAASTPHWMSQSGSEGESRNSSYDTTNISTPEVPYRRKPTYGNNSQYPSSEILASSSVTSSPVQNESIDYSLNSVGNIRSTVEGQGHTVDMTRSRSGLADPEPVPQPRNKTRRRLTTKRTLSFKRLEDDEYIGFASLPEQVHRKAVKRGFEFTLMVVGETGLGKSTLINSLFLTDLYKDRKVDNLEDRVVKTVGMEKKELEIEERGVKLKLTIVDTPGYNDAVNSEESWKPIIEYIDKQFELYYKAESGLNRKNIQDTRVHCCLYFISPYGHGLRPVDILVMKKLHHKVNIVPLIAKADMLTKPEVKRLKEKVLSEISKHHIQIYQFPDCDSDEDEDFKQQDTELKQSIPFAVVGSNTVVEAGGKKVRGRMYPWGIVEVENPKHCDFIRLRQMLISTHMQDLKDITADTHYENYRAEHIAEDMSHTQKERNKLKRDSSPNLDKVLDTEKLLQQKEAEIQKMQQMLARMQAQLKTNQGNGQVNGQVGHV